MTTSIATLRLLLWKDLRQHRQVLVGIVVLLLLPFVFSAVQGLRSTEPAEPYGWAAAAGVAAMFFAVCSSAIVGGALFASERAAGSADVLQLLVPRRSMLLASRGLFAVVALSIGLGTATVVSLAAGTKHAEQSEWAMPLEDLVQLMGLAASMNLAALGVGWAASAVLRSPVISASLGIGVALLVALLIATESPSGIERSEFDGPTRVMVLDSAIGLLGLVGGSVLYLRRTSP